VIARHWQTQLLETLVSAARNPLILNGEMSEWLKEHTLEIALTVRDGVPQISITVADPESQVRARHVNRSPGVHCYGLELRPLAGTIRVAHAV
jgi:hypothetical protein